MKILQKRMACMVLIALMLCCVQPCLVQANEYDISLMYAQSNRCTLKLTFSGNTANCRAVIAGKNGTSSISGTLKLYDATDEKNVKSWTISQSGAEYSGTKTATVKKGHSYTLSFSGKVYSKNNTSGESISSSVSKSN